MYSHNNESCTYVQSKQANKELPPNKCLLFTHTVTYTNLLIRRRHHMHLYKKQRKATPKDKGGRQVRGPNVTWSLDDRPGTRDRRVLPAPSWRDGGKAATSTLHSLAWQHLPRVLGLVGELSPAFSTRTRRLASRNRHHGWGGERTGLLALSQRRRSVWGNCCCSLSTSMLSQRVDALSSELTLSMSTLDRTGSGKLSLAVASTLPLFPAVVPT